MSESTSCACVNVDKITEWEQDLLIEVQEVLGVGTEKVIVTGVS